MAEKKKYYTVWKGRKTGVFNTWEACKEQVFGYEGAQYKSFPTEAAARFALQKGPEAPQAKKQSHSLDGTSQIIIPSLSVDAACSGNPGVMEYRGVLTHNQKEIFLKGPFQEGTNNVGEFLALVHGLALLKSKASDLPLYSDSKTAISWVRKKKCNTKLTPTTANQSLFELIKRAETWLKENTYTTTILKWDTKNWGEIPADFGRK